MSYKFLLHVTQIKKFIFDTSIKFMNYILHIDTSTDISSISISSDGNIVAFKENNETKNHAGTINTLIQETLDSVNIKFTDLSGIAVCAGPGSYTGLRIGLATAKGLCYAMEIPLYLHNRLSLLVWQNYIAYNNIWSHYASIIKAREKEYFITVFDNNYKCIIEPVHITEDYLKNHSILNEKTLFISDIGEEINKIFNSGIINVMNITKISHFYWAKYAQKEQIEKKNVEIWKAEPYYLKQVYTHN